MRKKRLTRQSWIDAGLTALTEQGPSALAAEPLARALGTTKGSFYWHYKDVPAFQAAVVKDWQSRAFAEIVKALADSAPADQRLRQFGRAFLADPTDPALRAWAQGDAMVAQALAQVDAERLTYIASLLRQLGLANAEFAQSCLGALVGLRQLPGTSSPTAGFETLIDLVLALR